MKNLIYRFSIHLALFGMFFQAVLVPLSYAAEGKGGKDLGDFEAKLSTFSLCCKLTSTGAQGGGLAARNTKTGATIRLKADSKKLLDKEFKVGQNVYVDSSGTLALVTPFPIQGHRRDKLGHARKMETTITISENGRIDAETRTWTAEALRGFTGGVVVAITDKDKNVLYTTKLRKFGVNGKNVPGAPSDRKEKWSESVPAEVINAAAGYAIFHQVKPTERLSEFLKDTEEGLKKLKEIIVIVAAIIAIFEGSDSGGSD